MGNASLVAFVRHVFLETRLVSKTIQKYEIENEQLSKQTVNRECIPDCICEICEMRN